MPRLQIPLYPPHPAQLQILTEADRFNVVVLGRRSGKTQLGIRLAVTEAIQQYPVGWFVPEYKDLLEVWHEITATLAPVIQRSNQQERRIELIGKGVIECWSLDNEDAGRGRRYKRAIIDEAAKAKNLETAWSRAIRPTLVDFKGDAWFLSTPKGMNYFHTLFQMGVDGAPGWRSWQMPTTCNPFMDAAEIEAARTDGTMSARDYAQEFMAEFIADGVGIFRGVLEAAVLKPQGPIEDHEYICGIDWGKLADWSCVSVLDLTTMRQVALDRFNQIDYVFQLKRLQNMVDIYKPRRIVAEKNSMGEVLIEQLRRLGMPVTAWTATNASKQDAIEALALAIEKGELQLLADKVQTSELLAYDAERLPGGLLRYGAPSGMHDDTVMALAMAYTQVRNGWMMNLFNKPVPMTDGSPRKVFALPEPRIEGVAP